MEKHLFSILAVLVMLSGYACQEAAPAPRSPQATAGATAVPPSLPAVAATAAPPAPAPATPPPATRTQPAAPLPATPGARSPQAAPSPAPASRWGNRAPLPEPNSEFAVAELDGKIYVIGGYPSTRVTVTTVQVYDSRADSWQITTPLPQPANHGMAAGVNGKVYHIGGQSTADAGPDGAGYLDAVYEYDPATARWVSRAPVPTKRSAGVAMVIGDKIYVAGGRPPRGNDFAVYDTRANTWTALPDLPTQRNHIAGAAIGGWVYVVGGRFGGGFNSDVTDVLEMYDPATNAWTRKAPMPTKRGGINGIGVGDCFYVWGGEGNRNNPTGLFDELEVYHAATDSWSSLGKMAVTVHGVTGAAFIDGLIFIPGGGIAQGGSSGSTIHQVLRPEATCS